MDALFTKVCAEHHFAKGLDIGAGKGVYAAYLAERGAHVTAIDLLAAPQHLLGNQRVAWWQGNVADYAFPPNTYDLIITRNIIHFITREAFVEKVAPGIIDALLPGGYLYAVVFNAQDIVFQSGRATYYSIDELKTIFRTLKFIEVVPQSVHDDHPPYSKHTHELTFVLAKKPRI